MKTQIIKVLMLAQVFIIILFSSGARSQNPAYTLTLTNDTQKTAYTYEFDIYLLRTGAIPFEYANNSQYYININPAIINGGILTFTIIPGTCQLNIIQQILSSRVSFDSVNNRLRIAAHTPSGAGTGTMISNTIPGTRLGRFRVTNTVFFAAAQANLNWYNGPAGFYTKIFAYVANNNIEITVSSNHLLNLNNPVLTDVEPNAGKIPSEFRLFQNYPNPFNPVTKIKFDIPVGDRHAYHLQLKIYDILGREMAVLVNKELKAGSYEIEWDAANYPSGIYFYKIIISAFTDVKKMILVK